MNASSENVPPPPDEDPPADLLAFPPSSPPPPPNGPPPPPEMLDAPAMIYIDPDDSSSANEEEDEDVAPVVELNLQVGRAPNLSHQRETFGAFLFCDFLTGSMACAFSRRATQTRTRAPWR